MHPLSKKTPKKKSSLRYSSNFCTGFIFALGFWFFDVGPDRSLGYSLKFTATDRFLKIQERHGTSCYLEPADA